jgi:hypothetical protein
MPVPRPSTAAAGTVARAGDRNTLLLGLFALQHSVIGAAGLQAWWTALVPQPVERHDLRAVRSLACALLYWQMAADARPVGRSPIRSASSPPGVSGSAGAGAASALLINHFELFGLRQVWARLRGRRCRPAFRTPFLYKRAPSALSRLPARLLGDADDDHGPLCCSRWRPPAIS